jgi:hypothetical protein
MQIRYMEWLLGAAVLCAGTAFARTPQLGIYGHAVVLPAQPAALAVTLYDQSTTCSVNAQVSQKFEAANAAFDSQAADDFAVPAGVEWDVSQVFAAGLYFNGPGPAPMVNVQFYQNIGGIPAVPVAGCTYSNLTTFADASGAFTISLPTSCELFGGAGKSYWVSVSARMDFTPSGEWGWKGRTPQQGNPAQWQNPGNGLGSGCTTWGSIVTCAAAQEPDRCFSISGGTGNDIIFQDGFGG